MNVRMLVVCALALGAPGALRAQEAELPAFAETALEAFVSAGADSAIAVWLRGTSLDAPATRATLAQGFSRLAEQAGRMVGYDVLTVVPVGTHVRRAYVVLHYERSPAYLYLELYRYPHGWGTLTVRFNGDPEVVVPQRLLES